MTAKVLMTGTLFARPEKRSLRNGALCVTAILKIRQGNHTRLWHIAAFRETVKATLLRLSEGDAVAVQGLLKAELYDSSGETRLSCGVIAERALGLHGPFDRKEREAAIARPQNDIKALAESLKEQDLQIENMRGQRESEPAPPTATGG
jgi:Single-strand binding protein family